MSNKYVIQIALAEGAGVEMLTVAEEAQRAFDAYLKYMQVNGGAAFNSDEVISGFDVIQGVTAQGGITKTLVVYGNIQQFSIVERIEPKVQLPPSGPRLHNA